MMSRKTAKLIAAVIALILVATMVFGVVSSGIFYAQAATSVSRLQKQLSSIESQKKEVQSEINALNKRIDVVSEKKAALDKQMELTQDEIDTTESLIAQLGEQIEVKTVELAAAEKALVEKQDLFSERIRVMYENGEVTYLDVLLAAENLSDMLSRLEIVSQIMDYDKQVVAEYNAARAEIAEKKASLESDQQEQESYRAGLQDKYDSLDADREEQKRLIAGLNADKDKAKAEYEKMEKQMQDTRDEIAEMSRKAAEEAARAAAARAAAAKRNSSSGTGGGSTSSDSAAVTPTSGTFTWPCPGHSNITSPYGWRTHPIYGNRRLHAGADVGAPTGATIVAAADGTVVKSYMSNSYGNYTVISHGGGIMTAYAHQSKRLVSEGDTVTKGQVIGKVGSTGNVTGPHLHFEVYVNGSTVNPMQYFN